MFILFKMLLFKGGVLIYAEHCFREEEEKTRGAHQKIKEYMNRDSVF